MKIYKIVLCFVDHDDVGPEGAAALIENARLPNHVNPGTVVSVDERDCGEWHDGHPLNYDHSIATAFAALFAETR